jgi:hypothetical protein
MSPKEPTRPHRNGNSGQGVSCAGIFFSNSDGFFIFFNVPLNMIGVFGSDGEALTISKTPGGLPPVPEPAPITSLAFGIVVAVLALYPRSVRACDWHS